MSPMLTARIRVLILAALPLTAAEACTSSDPTNTPQGGDASLPDVAASPEGNDAAPDSAATPEAGSDAEAGTGADGAADAGNDAAIDGGPDSAVTPQPGDLFVNAASGLDTNAGTKASPLRTLTKAMSLAASGKTVWLEDGTWDRSVDATLGASNAAPPCSGTGVVIPAGVSVRSVNAGGATIVVEGSNGFCTDGGGTLAGFIVHRQVPDGGGGGGGGAGIVLRAGTTSLVGVKLTSTSPYTEAEMLRLVGTAKATMEPSGLATYATGLGVAITLESPTTELTIHGGAFTDPKGAITARAAHIAVTSGAKLVLDGVTLDRPAANTGNLIGVRCTGGTVELRGASLIRGFKTGDGLWLDFGSTALVTDTSVIRENNRGIHVSGFGAAGVATTLSLSGSSAVRNNTQNGIRGDFNNGHKLDLSIQDSATVTENGTHGVEYSGGTLAMTGGSITNNTGNGLMLYTGLTSASVRNATLTGNGGHGAFLMAFAGTADLGTAASPGNNVLKDNAATVAGAVNLRVDRDGVTAVGNTWQPSVQGADATGKFTSPDGGALYLTGPIQNAGKNFWIQTSGHKLKVAGP